MANSKSYTFTKSKLAQMRASEAKMTPKQKKAVSKALVEANTAANTVGKKKKA